MNLILTLPDDLQEKLYAEARSALTGWNSPAKSVISKFMEDLVTDMLKDPEVKRQIQESILLEFRDEQVLKQVIKNLLDME